MRELRISKMDDEKEGMATRTKHINSLNGRLNWR